MWWEEAVAFGGCRAVAEGGGWERAVYRRRSFVVFTYASVLNPVTSTDSSQPILQVC